MRGRGQDLPSSCWLESSSRVSLDTTRFGLRRAANIGTTASEVFEAVQFGRSCRRARCLSFCCRARARDTDGVEIVGSAPGSEECCAGKTTAKIPCRIVKLPVSLTVRPMLDSTTLYCTSTRYDSHRASTAAKPIINRPTIVTLPPACHKHSQNSERYVANTTLARRPDHSHEISTWRRGCSCN